MLDIYIYTYDNAKVINIKYHGFFLIFQRKLFPLNVQLILPML